MRSFQIVSSGVFVASILALVIVAWLVIGRALKPIDELVVEASEAARGNMSVTVLVRRHDEVGALAYAFNTMIDRLRELIASPRAR